MEVPGLFVSSSGFGLRSTGTAESSDTSCFSALTSPITVIEPPGHAVDCEARMIRNRRYNTPAYDVHTQAYTAGMMCGSHIPVGVAKEWVADALHYEDNVAVFDPFCGNTVATAQDEDSELFVMCTPSPADPSTMTISLNRVSTESSDGGSQVLHRSAIAQIAVDAPILDIQMVCMVMEDDALQDAEAELHTTCPSSSRIYAIAARCHSAITLVTVSIPAAGANNSVHDLAKAAACSIVDCLRFSSSCRPYSMHLVALPPEPQGSLISLCVITESFTIIHWMSTFTIRNAAVKLTSICVCEMDEGATYPLSSCVLSFQPPRMDDSDPKAKASPDLTRMYPPIATSVQVAHVPGFCSARPMFHVSVGCVLLSVWADRHETGLQKAQSTWHRTTAICKPLTDLRHIPIPPVLREVMGARSLEAVQADQILKIVLATSKDAPHSVHLISRFRMLAVDIRCPMKPLYVTPHHVMTSCPVAVACFRQPAARGAIVSLMLVNADGICSQSSVTVVPASGPTVRWAHSLHFPSSVNASCWCRRIAGLAIVRLPRVASGFLRITAGQFGTICADIGSTNAVGGQLAFRVENDGPSRNAPRAIVQHTCVRCSDQLSAWTGELTAPEEQAMPVLSTCHQHCCHGSSDDTVSMSHKAMKLQLMVLQPNRLVLNNPQSSPLLEAYLRVQCVKVDDFVQHYVLSSTRSVVSSFRKLHGIYCPDTTAFEYSVAARMEAKEDPREPVDAGIVFNHAITSGADLSIRAADMQKILPEELLGWKPSQHYPVRQRQIGRGIKWRGVRRRSGLQTSNDLQLPSVNDDSSSDDESPLGELFSSPTSRLTGSQYRPTVDTLSLISYLRTKLDTPHTLFEISLQLKQTIDYGAIILPALASLLLSNSLFFVTVLQPVTFSGPSLLALPPTPSTGALQQDMKAPADPRLRYVLSRDYNPVAVFQSAKLRADGRDADFQFFGVKPERSREEIPSQGCEPSHHDQLPEWLRYRFPCPGNSEKSVFAASIPSASASDSQAEDSSARIRLGHYDCELDAVLAVSAAVGWGQRMVGRWKSSASELYASQQNDPPSQQYHPMLPGYDIPTNLSPLLAVKVNLDAASTSASPYSGVVPDAFINPKADTKLAGVSEYRVHKASGAGSAAGVGTISPGFGGRRGIFGYRAIVMRKQQDGGRTTTKQVVVGMFPSALEACAMNQMQYARPVEELGTPLPPPLAQAMRVLMYHVAVKIEDTFPDVRLEPVQATYPHGCPEWPSNDQITHMVAGASTAAAGIAEASSFSEAEDQLPADGPILLQQCECVQAFSTSSTLEITCCDPRLCMLPHCLVFSASPMSVHLPRGTSTKKQKVKPIPEDAFVQSSDVSFFEGFTGEQEPESEIPTMHNELEDEFRILTGAAAPKAAVKHAKHAPPERHGATADETALPGLAVLPKAAARAVKHGFIGSELTSATRDKNVLMKRHSATPAQSSKSLQALPIAPVSSANVKECMKLWRDESIAQAPAPKRARTAQPAVQPTETPSSAEEEAHGSRRHVTYSQNVQVHEYQSTWDV